MERAKEVTKVQELVYELKVEQAMTRDVITVTPQTSMSEFREILRVNRISGTPVLENGQIGALVKCYRTTPQNDFQRALRGSAERVTHHEAARLSSINLERMSHIPPGGNWTNIPIGLLPKGMQRARRSDHTKRYGRVDPDGLASTILTKCDPHWGAYFHYNQDRAFTVREAARIQTFPDSFLFAGSRGEQYEQVGNAVPPFLAAAIGQSLVEALGHESVELSRAI